MLVFKNLIRAESFSFLRSRGKCSESRLSVSRALKAGLYTRLCYLMRSHDRLIHVIAFQDPDSYEEVIEEDEEEQG